jgi:predicted TIM-barrel fold metal-dependent hydrolase
MTTSLAHKAPAHDYPIYDADHHYYEPPEAFLRYLPKQFRKDFQYVSVDGRTKLAVDGVLSDYIPNPAFEVVAAPGSHEKYYRATNADGLTLREMTGKPIRSQPAFHNGAAHLRLMDEQRLHGALVFPTLASVIEVRLGHKPELIKALFHSLNQWVADEYGFANGRQFPVAAISLTDVDDAVRELEFAMKAGCRAVLIRPAPVPGPSGGRSPGAREFDPFWARCAEAKVLVAHHVSDSGYDRIYRWWTGGEVQEMRAFERDAFKDALDGMGRAAADTINALVCHGMFDRNPGVRVAMVETGSAWVEPMLKRLARTYRKMPQEFKRHPVETIREHVYVMPFYEDSARDLGDLIGMDKVLFGSDWPHPEGLADPLSFFHDIDDLTPTEQKMVMSDNLRNLLEGGWD